MNKKYLALIGLVIVLISVILALVLSQSLIQNATVQADSLELQIRGMYPSLSFIRIDNKTLVAESLLTRANVTDFSKTEFLSYISKTMYNPQSSGGIQSGGVLLRCENTFYFYGLSNVIASCTPSHMSTYTPPVSNPSPSSTPSIPTPNNSGFVGGSEQVEIRQISFLSNSTVAITIKNTGTSDVTVQEVWVNNVDKTSVSSNATSNVGLPLTIPVNSQYTINTSLSWVAGDNYQFKIVTAKGNPFMKNAIPPS